MIAEISKIKKRKKEINLSPSSTLSYTITKKSKRVNFRCKSDWGSWSSWRFSLIALSLGFTVIRVFFRFLSDRILFMVLNDKIFFESSEIGSSSLGSTVTYSFLHQCSFSAMSLFLLSNRVTTFSSKTDVLFCIHYNSQKQLAWRILITSAKLIPKKMKKYMIETQSVILKIYVINSPIYTCHQIPDEFK